MSIQTFDVNFDRPAPGSAQPFINLIYINDQPTSADVLDTVIVSLPDKDTSIVLVPQENQTASCSNHHFEIYFTPDTLAQAQSIACDGSAWSMAYVQHQLNDQDTRAGVSFYFLYKGEDGTKLDPGQSVTVRMTGVGATSTNGARTATVQFNWNAAVGPDNDPIFVRFQRADGSRIPPPPPYITSITKAVDIVNAGSLAHPPLYAGFITSDVVINDGTTQNYLVLRITNLGDKALPLNPGKGLQTKLAVSFVVNNDAQDIGALVTESQRTAIYLPGNADSSGNDYNWPSRTGWHIQSVGGPSGEWVFSPRSGKTSFERGENLDFPISNLVTGHAMGRTVVHLRYEGFPGYGAGEMAIPLQKAPILYKDGVIGRLGIGTTTPRDHLHITGGGITLESDGQGITFSGGAKIWEAAGNGLKIKAHLDYQGIDFLKADGVTSQMYIKNGNVGIGTTSPGDRLVVNSTTGFGITHTDGEITLSTRVGSEGAAVGTRSAHSLLFMSNGATRMALTTSGRLGIGTVDPDDKLHITGGGITLESDGQGIAFTGGARIWKQSGSGLKIKVHSDFHGIEVLKADGVTSQMLIAGGNVGIGTTHPADKLHISNGGIKIDGGGITLESDGQGISFMGGARIFKKSGDGLKIQATAGDHVEFVKSDGVTRQLLIAGDTVDFQGQIQFKGHSPIESWEKMVYADAPNITTSYRVSDWVAAVVGVNAYSPKGSARGFKFVPLHGDDGYWYVACDINGVEEDYWILRMLFFRRELVGGGGWA